MRESRKLEQKRKRQTEYSSLLVVVYRYGYNVLCKKHLSELRIFKFWQSIQKAYGKFGLVAILSTSLLFLIISKKKTILTEKQATTIIDVYPNIIEMVHFSLEDQR